jgi:hypothetical protein
VIGKPGVCSVPIGVLVFPDSLDHQFVTFDADGLYSGTLDNGLVETYLNNHFYGFGFAKAAKNRVIKWNTEFKEVKELLLKDGDWEHLKEFPGNMFFLSTSTDLLIINSDLQIVRHEVFDIPKIGKHAGNKKD